MLATLNIFVSCKYLEAYPGIKIHLAIIHIAPAKSANDMNLNYLTLLLVFLSY